MIEKTIMTAHNINQDAEKIINQITEAENQKNEEEKEIQKEIHNVEQILYKTTDIANKLGKHAVNTTNTETMEWGKEFVNNIEGEIQL